MLSGNVPPSDDIAIEIHCFPTIKGLKAYKILLVVLSNVDCFPTCSKIGPLQQKCIVPMVFYIGLIQPISHDLFEYGVMIGGHSSWL